MVECKYICLNNNVRFRGVVGLGSVPYILCTLKHPEGKASQEISGGE